MYFFFLKKKIFNLGKPSKEPDFHSQHLNIIKTNKNTSEIVEMKLAI